MTRQPVWTDRALKDAARLDPRTRERIVRALDQLVETGRGDVKPLKGAENQWRLRVGRTWRVRFTIQRQTLVILRVLPRGGAYKK